MALMVNNNTSDGGILLSLNSHTAVPAQFVTKTYQLVDDPTTDHIASWGDDGTTFVVWRLSEFEHNLLPNYFKHNRFSSFQRQLNRYGFRKIVPDRLEFANNYFKKGEKHLLCEIHRRKTSSQQPQIPIHHHHPGGFFPNQTRGSISPPDSDDSDNDRCECVSPLLMSSPTGGCWLGVTNNSNSTSWTALLEENKMLRRRNTMLMSELAHRRKLYNDSNSYGNGGQQPLNHLIGYTHQQQHQNQSQNQNQYYKQVNPTVHNHQETTKLFGVPLQ